MSFSAMKASGAEDLVLARLKSEIKEMALTGKQVSERLKAGKDEYERFSQRVQE